MSHITNLFNWLFGGVGVVAVGAAWKSFRSRRPSRPSPVPSLQPPTIEQLKERAHILVVDDQSFEYLPALEREGFRVKWLRDLESTVEIEQGMYDVVLLDLHGVATSISSQQGIGALKQIKRASPAQMLVAYSAAAWPVTESRETQVADVVLDKAQSAFPDFRQSIVDLLLKSVDPSHYIASLESLCSQATDRVLGERLPSLRLQTREALLRFVASGSGEDLAEISRLLEERGLKDGRRPQIHAIATLARKRLRPWLL